MACKAVTPMLKVGKRGTQNRARGRRRNFCAKRIGLSVPEREQHVREMELVVDGPSLQRQEAAFCQAVRSAFVSSTQPW